MDVRIFKFASGVELIAESSGQLSADGAKYTIKRPLQIHVMRGPDGAPSMGFAPWCMVADDEVFEVFVSSLACAPLNPLAEIAASYVENVTGIVIPPAQPAGRILMG